MHDSRFSTRLRVVLKVALVFGCVSCEHPTAPPTVYTLITINGHTIPAPLYPGAAHDIVSASLALGPGNQFVEIVHVRCRDQLPPGTTCDAAFPDLRDEGTYSIQTNSITFNGTEFQATFVDDRIGILFGGDGQTGAGTEIWVFQRS